MVESAPDSASQSVSAPTSTARPSCEVRSEPADEARPSDGAPGGKYSAGSCGPAPHCVSLLEVPDDGAECDEVGFPHVSPGL